MKQLLVLFGIVLTGIPMIAGAQVQGTQASPKDSTRMDPMAHFATRQTDMLKTELDLDTTQYRKMLEVNTRLATERQEMWRAEAQIHQQNMDKVQKDKEEAYKKILSADQLKKWQDMMQEMNARRAEHFRSGPGDRRPGGPPHDDTHQGVK